MPQITVKTLEVLRSVYTGEKKGHFEKDGYFQQVL